MFQKTLAAAITAWIMAQPGVAHAQGLTLDMRRAAADGAFEEGTYQALGAIEGMLQDVYRYGIGQGFGTFMRFQNGDLRNPTPAPREADTFRTIMQDFATDLEAARVTLARTDPDRATPFVVDLKELWFDVNANGALDPGEAASQILGPVFNRPRSPMQLPEGPLEVRFDGADHAWLTAYTHVHSLMAEAVLAFDPTPVFADLMAADAELSDLPEIPNFYDADAIRAEIETLKAALADANAAIQTSRDVRQSVQENLAEAQAALNGTQDTQERDAMSAVVERLQEQMNSTQQDANAARLTRRFLTQQIASAQAKLPPDAADPDLDLGARRARQRAQQWGDTRNAVYALFEVLRQPPDRARISRVEQHMRGMIAQNRLFWEKVALETDDDREWVPNPDQTSAFGLTVSAELADTWQNILADAEAVMDGRLLVPHPLLAPEIGINVAAWFENPSSLDPVGWIHGRAAYPYLARGPRTTRSNWLALQRLTGGNAIAFSLFFN